MARICDYNAALDCACNQMRIENNVDLCSDASRARVIIFASFISMSLFADVIDFFWIGAK